MKPRNDKGKEKEQEGEGEDGHRGAMRAFAGRFFQVVRHPIRTRQERKEAKKLQALEENLAELKEALRRQQEPIPNSDAYVAQEEKEQEKAAEQRRKLAERAEREREKAALADSSDAEVLELPEPSPPDLK